MFFRLFILLSAKVPLKILV